MEVFGALTYTVTYSDDENKFTISASGNFELELSETTITAWDQLGYTAGIDTGLDTSHEADEIRIHTGEELYFDLGTARNLYFIAIKNHNLQNTATITVRFYSDAWVTIAETQALTWNEGLIVSALNQYYRYVSIHMADRDNPDLYVEIGRVWLGDYFQPKWGFSMEREKAQNDPSVIAESENGQVSTIQRTKYDTWNYSFEGIAPDDHDDMEAIFQEVGTSRALFICEDPSEVDLTENTHYVTISSWEWEHIAGDWWKLFLEIKEER
jgi:hypothetical protein